MLTEHHQHAITTMRKLRADIERDPEDGLWYIRGDLTPYTSDDIILLEGSGIISPVLAHECNAREQDFSWRPRRLNPAHLKKDPTHV